MKRWIFTILLFLLLGAVVNVAVAYACFLFADIQSSHEEPLVQIPEWVNEYSVRDYDRYIDRTRYGFGIERHEYWYHSGSATEYSKAGWPFRVVYGGRFENKDGKELFAKALSPYRTAARRYLPTEVFYIPIGVELRGLILNTAMYAGLLWLLIPGPFVLRRHVRVKRGRCSKCGYDLRGAPSGGGCPECGWNREEATA